MTDTKQRITAAATEVLRRRGYHDTSIKDVVAASGATVGSTYHFFPGGKAELVATVVVESGAAYGELFRLFVAEAGDPVDAVARFFEAAADALEASDFVDLCPIGTIAGEVASTDEALRRACDGVFAGWVEALAAALVDAGRPAELADEQATTVVAALQGGFMLSRAARRAQPLRAAGRQMVALLRSDRRRRQRDGAGPHRRGERAPEEPAGE